MRSGPSTGMPTKQEQGDLNMMLYGGHGEIPRFVVAPTSIDECFWKTVEAFNFAEKYQVPVYVAADLAMAVTEQTFSPETFDMDEVEIDRGKVVDETPSTRGSTRRVASRPTRGRRRRLAACVPRHDRRRAHDDRPRTRRTRPADRRHGRAYRAGRQAPAEGRDRPRAGGLRLPRVRRLRRRYARHLLGLQRRSPREALTLLEEDGIDVRFLSVPYMFPRPDLTEEIEAADEVIVVECNATGQFANVVEHDTLTRVKRINKYDGVRFKADELADEIKATLDAEEVSA